MQMLTVVDLFSCFSTSVINLAIRDDSNAYGNKSSAASVDPFEVNDEKIISDENVENAISCDSHVKSLKIS